MLSAFEVLALVLKTDVLNRYIFHRELLCNKVQHSTEYVMKNNCEFDCQDGLLSGTRCKVQGRSYLGPTLKLLP